MWLELSFATSHPEFAEEILFAHEAASVTFADAADHPVLEPLPGETPLWPLSAVRGLFRADAELAAVHQALREQLPDGAQLKISQRTVEDQDWVHAWLQHARPMRFGERLWICPSGHRIGDTNAAVVHLDPGLAFGTGAHPSTALCLEWLAQQTLAGKQVLDYGCGSGILAIAALKLGADSAIGVDIDPQALIATRDNALLNGVAQRLLCASLEQFHEQASAKAVDIVLANILARPLIELAPLLAQCLRIGGRLALAGLLETQAAEVRDAYAPWFEFEPDALREDWARVAGIRVR